MQMQSLRHNREPKNNYNLVTLVFGATVNAA
jgi:hypothetical protein